MDWNIPLDDERTLSIEQFCEVEGLSRRQFEELWMSRVAPPPLKVILFSGELVRITPQGRRWWHETLKMAFEDGQSSSDEIESIEWDPLDVPKEAVPTASPDPTSAKES